MDAHESYVCRIFSIAVSFMLAGKSRSLTAGDNWETKHHGRYSKRKSNQSSKQKRSLEEISLKHIIRIWYRIQYQAKSEKSFELSSQNFGPTNRGHLCLRLVPGEELKKALEKDFDAMVSAGMFYADPPAFAEILARLAEVEKALNESLSAHYKTDKQKDGLSPV